MKCRVVFAGMDQKDAHTGFCRKLNLKSAPPPLPYCYPLYQATITIAMEI